MTKFDGYFRLPSVRHYLILDPDGAVAMHHYRRDDGAIQTELLSEGLLRLDPPGLNLDLGALFGAI